MGQDAPRWPEKGFLRFVLTLKRPHLEVWKLSPGVRQVGTKATFVLCFTIQTAHCLNFPPNFGAPAFVLVHMPMCILYCILQIRMLLRCAALAAVFGYGGVSWASKRLEIGQDRSQEVLYHEPPEADLA